MLNKNMLLKPMGISIAFHYGAEFIQLFHEPGPFPVENISWLLDMSDLGKRNVFPSLGDAASRMA